MDKFPLAVNYDYYKGDPVFQKEEKCILKITNSPLTYMYFKQKIIF